MHIFRKRSVKYLENARKITREEQENCPSRVKRVTDWCQTCYGLGVRTARGRRRIGKCAINSKLTVIKDNDYSLTALKTFGVWRSITSRRIPATANDSLFNIIRRMCDCIKLRFTVNRPRKERSLVRKFAAFQLRFEPSF